MGMEWAITAATCDGRV